ncbi:RNA 2',3'-cyclic phosphodiesterase [Lentibacillus saliphilus]|uniref:RNA 2',3'-cyclic phosphodiesterase n=1 Tax=Lentibacillus saliphilus TaxID=2737028 RepID=UPI001C2FFB8D|nr:RNA 2',3'-cyclic phosphodiesterase [Lentibacillus saliphilus]
MKNSAHYFIAIGLPNDIKSWLLQKQEALKPLLPYQIWTYEEDLHVTLKFLGAVNDEQLTAIDQELNNADLGYSFSLQLGTLGFFGHSNRPRILWAGVEHKQALFDLYHQIKSLMSNHYFSPEKRPYRPHVTLAKKWGGQAFEIDRLKHIQSTDQTFKTIWIDHVNLYKIDPSERPKYTCINTYDLKRGETHGSTR